MRNLLASKKAGWFIAPCFVAQKVTPLLVARGEFRSIRFDEALAWIVAWSSGLIAIGLALAGLAIGYFLLSRARAYVAALAGLLYGIGLSLWVFPG